MGGRRRSLPARTPRGGERDVGEESLRSPSSSRCCKSPPGRRRARAAAPLHLGVSSNRGWEREARRRHLLRLDAQTPSHPYPPPAARRRRYLLQSHERRTGERRNKSFFFSRVPFRRSGGVEGDDFTW